MLSVLFTVLSGTNLILSMSVVASLNLEYLQSQNVFDYLLQQFMTFNKIFTHCHNNLQAEAMRDTMPMSWS